MKMKSIRNSLIYLFSIGASILLLLFVVMCSWIGNEVISQCDTARMEYGGDCVESLVKRLNDETSGYKARNDAIWALGQLGDSRALADLRRYYTGNIPAREPLDKSLSQYELRKAINLTSGGTNPLAWTWRGRLSNNSPMGVPAIKIETIIVAQKADPYYSLAEKIAQEEGAEIVEGVDEALKLSPKYVILVSSPANLTSDRLSCIGKLFQTQNQYPGFGIISGSTLEKAGQLWANRSLVKSGTTYLGGDVDILQNSLEPAIYSIGGGSQEKIPLTKDNLIQTLKQADYFYWVRHTGPRDWSWNEGSGNWTVNDQLLAADIPNLQPAVIYSLTCSSFRPWVENSIAIGFVDRGAAAFLGLVNTPHTASFLRDALNVPGITSWSEFPLGLVAQVQNKVTAKTVFTSPQLFMLGDPRIYISPQAPYQIMSDTVIDNGKRILKGASDERGVLAVKINKGAQYSYLSVKELSSVSENDIFYNNKIQTLNLGESKYVLFLHHGGKFKIELLPEDPFGWKITDAVVDAFDFSWVVLWLGTYTDGNPHILLISIAVFAGIILFKIIKQKKSIKDYSRVFLAALLFMLVRLGYFLLRVDDYTVSSNLVSYTPLQIGIGCIGIFASVAGGLIIMQGSTRLWVKSLGLLFAAVREFWMVGFYLIFITLLNGVTPITRNTETWLLSYDNFWLSFIVFAIEVIFMYAVYRFAIRNKEPNILSTK